MRIGIDIDNTMCGTDEIIDTKIEEYIKEKKMTPVHQKYKSLF